MRKLFIVLGFIWFNNVVSQVTPQSGSATFSLPIFSWKDDQSRLANAISLDYSSGTGFKVNELGSNVGQGWRLAGLGVITRIQVGQPDDQVGYSPDPNGPDKFKRYPVGSLYNTQDISQGCPGALAKYPIWGHRNQIYAPPNDVVADRELDYFAFQFAGKSGMFVLPRNNQRAGVFLEDSKMKVWFEEQNNQAAGIRTSIVAFKIKDVNGLTYTFSQYETTEILKTAYFDPKTNRQKEQPDFKSNGIYHEGAFSDNEIAHPKVIHSWYLKEIKDSLTNRVITFNYNLRNINTKSGISLSYFDEKNYSIVSHSYSKTVTPEIASIQFPDNHQVLFGYGDERIDMPGARVMKYIDIKYQNRYVSKYNLATSYFIRNRYGYPTTDFQVKSARLCLLSVQRVGVDLKDIEHPYTFDYYLGTGTTDDFVPPPFFYARDVWGFYNGTESKDFSGTPVNLLKDVSDLTNSEVRGLCFLRNGSVDPNLLNSKPGIAKYGLLKQVVYPTGGALRYEYEQNKFNWGSGLKDVAGVHVSRTLLSDGGFSNTCGNPIITNYTYLDSSGNSSLWGLEMPNNKTTAKQFYVPEERRLKWKPIANLSCVYKYRYPGILSRDQSISLTSQEQTLATLSTIMDVVSAISTAVDIIKLCIAYTPAAVIAIVVDVIASIAGIILTCTGSPDSIDETVNVYSNSDINSINPLPSQFKRVEVTESSGGNGKTILEFTSPGDPNIPVIWAPTNPYITMRQRYATWAYGLPRKTTVLDGSGRKIKETENLYLSVNQPDYGDILLGNSGFLSCKCLVLKSSSQRDVDYLNPAHYNNPSSFISHGASSDNIRATAYNIKHGKIRLLSTIEKIYDVNNPNKTIQNLTQYGFDDLNDLVSTVTQTLSNGDVLSKWIAYSSDFNTGIFQTLNQKNILDLPVATTTMLKKQGESTFKMLEETVTEYVFVSNGDIRPSRILEQRFSTPAVSYVRYQGPNNPANPSYKETQTYIYNNASKLGGIKEEGDRVMINIYDYDNKYVVASVINANANTDKSAYTSFETTAFGGWILSGTAAYNNADAATGVRSFILSGTNSLSTSLTVSRAHIISFWADNGSVTVSGGTQTKSGPTINGFTYYEYRIAQGGGNTTIQGNAKIDELRSYPEMARMRTVSYDPVIGKTSECDENNRISYYDYDELGRLRFIKDEYRNVVKMYEYNSATYKPYGCTTIYTNNAITEIYKKSCASGYEGSDVSVTVPAGKYSSTESQYLADLQAEMELAAEGQTRANQQGSCILLYGNDAASVTFTKEGCLVGSIGSTVTYTVPANIYYSKIDKADANRMRDEEIEANGYSYAERTGTCTITTEPIWESSSVPQYSCEKNGSNQNTGTQLIQVTDINPNSPTYNTTQWKNAGVNTSACPLPPPPTCDPSSCNKPFLKCVNNQCEAGTYEMLFMTNNNNICTINYGYRFSDGSYKITHTEQTPGQCP